jgi:hypothetical protein
MSGEVIQDGGRRSTGDPRASERDEFYFGFFGLVAGLPALMPLPTIFRTAATSTKTTGRFFTSAGEPFTLPDLTHLARVLRLIPHWAAASMIVAFPPVILLYIASAWICANRPLL